MVPIPMCLSPSSQSLWQALFSQCARGWDWEAGVEDPLTSSAIEVPEPEGERSVSPVARSHVGSREGHATKKG